MQTKVVLTLLLLCLLRVEAQLTIQDLAISPYINHQCKCLHRHYIYAADVSGSMWGIPVGDYVVNAIDSLTTYSRNLAWNDDIKATVYKFNHNIIYLNPKFEHMTPCYFQNNPWTLGGGTSWNKAIIELTNLILRYRWDNICFVMYTDAWNSAYVSSTTWTNFKNAVYTLRKNGCSFSCFRVFVLPRSSFPTLSQQKVSDDESRFAETSKESTVDLAVVGSEFGLQVNEVGSVEEAQRILSENN